MTTPNAQQPATDLNPYGVKVRHELQTEGGVFVCTLYDAGTALDLMPWLLALAAGPAGLVMDLLTSAIKARDVMEGDISGGAAREGLLTLSREIVAHGGAAKVRELLATTTLKVPGQQALVPCSAQFDQVFQGRLPLLGRVVAWVLEVNYSPFSPAQSTEDWAGRLTQLLGRLLDEQQPQPSDSASPPDSGS